MENTQQPQNNEDTTTETTKALYDSEVAPVPIVGAIVDAELEDCGE